MSLTMNLYLQLTTKEDKPVISILTSHRELSTFITKQQVGYGMPMAQPLIDFVVNGGNRYGPSEKILSIIDDTNDARRGNFIRIYTNNAGHIPFDNNGYVGAILTKFLGNVGSDGLRENYNNIPIYRYADVLLLLAEAKNHLNEDPSAEINAVRQRAYGANFPGYQFTNGPKLKTLITF